VSQTDRELNLCGTEKRPYYCPHLGRPSVLAREGMQSGLLKTLGKIAGSNVCPLKKRILSNNYVAI
jgi:hypothetical protein